MPPTPDDDAPEFAELLGAADADHAQVVRAVYDELRVIARRYLVRERDHHTLEPTELVNEAYLKLVPPGGADPITQRRFIGFAARAMRQVLIDHARRRGADKRGAGWGRVTLRGVAQDRSDRTVDLVALDHAMRWLEETDGPLAEITEWHYFGGMTSDQIAAQRQVSRSTVTRDLAFARSLLLREIDRLRADTP
jgi:RNA polymerase sigma-70 factor (ECF subfamily)